MTLFQRRRATGSQVPACQAQPSVQTRNTSSPANSDLPTSTNRSDVQRRLASSAAPIADPTKQKLQHGHITTGDVELSRGPHGEVLATIHNTGNSLAFGYVRHDGSYSRASHSHTIRSQNSRLLSVTQDQTFSARVTYKDENKTVIALSIDPSVEIFHVKLAGKEYLIRATDIEKLNTAASASDVALPTPQPAFTDNDGARLTQTHDSIPESLSVSTQLADSPTSIVESSPSDRVLGDAAPATDADSSSIPLAAVPLRVPTHRIALPQLKQAALRSFNRAAESATSLYRTASRSVADLGSRIKETVTRAATSETAGRTARTASVEPIQGPPRTNLLKSSLERAQALGRDGIAKITEFSQRLATRNVPTRTPVPEATPHTARPPSRPTASNVEVTPEASRQGISRNSTAPAETPPPQTEPSIAQSRPATEGTAQSPTRSAQLTQSFRRWNQELRTSEWATANQFKAITLAASVSEAVTGALKADYGADDPHSPIPTLLTLLNKDFADAFSFTTQEGGLTAAIAAEATRSAADAGSAIALFHLADRGVMAAAGTRVGGALGGRAAAGVGMRFLGAAGVAYHGYSTFSDGSFADMNDLQIAGNTASPIVMGAIVGAPLGPVGAAGGALIGAGAETVGVFAGLATLESEITTDWKKREVRESLRYASMGFILPEDSVLVRRRKALTDLPEEHQTVLRRNAQITTLSLLNSTFSPQELQQLGFAPPLSPNASEAEKTTAGQANWDRVVQLTEGGYWLAAIYGDYIEQVRSNNPTLASKFESLFTESQKYWKDTFDHSPHLSLKLTANRVERKSELLNYITSTAQSIDLNASDSAIIRQLQQAFPRIDIIMQNENGRGLLINNLEQATGNTGRFRRLLDITILLGDETEISPSHASPHDESGIDTVSLREPAHTSEESQTTSLTTAA